MAAVPKLAEPKIKQWACGACTYLNDHIMEVCDMCSSSRPFIDEMVSKRSKSEVDSPSPRMSPFGPAAFIAALASLTPPATALSTTPLGYQQLPASLAKRVPSAGENKLRLLSWNTDGIYDQGFVRERSIETSNIIISESPDVILLQELVPESFELFKVRLGNAGYVAATPNGRHPAPYFCGVFVSNAFTVCLSSQKAFACGSYMYRDLSHVSLCGGSLGDVKDASAEGEYKKVHIYTSHLESMKSQGAVGSRSQDYRIRQLLETTDAMLEHSNSGEAALFAGDTNLRNDEVAQPKAASDVSMQDRYEAAFRPKQSAPIVDAFETIGEPGNHKFTWDCMINDNLNYVDFKPRARYDRCFFTREKLSVVPGSFHLVGTSKFSIHSNGKSLFPSDHFGLCMDFDVN
jgi:exonuclease III